VVDHIVPLAIGGTDTDDNVQSLCDPCHERKTALEDTAHGGAATHPNWLRPSAVPLTIVCGPPCAGKTTYVMDNAKAGDTVVDLDSIIAGIIPGYVHWSGMLTRDMLNRAMRARNAMLGALSRASHGTAWYIVSAPSADERMWWTAKLGGTVVLLNPGAAECKRRAVARGTPAAVDGIAKWYVRSMLPWRAPGAAIGLDGWPA
jgi:5-methylcytosine-specific restriction protein A